MDKPTLTPHFMEYLKQGLYILIQMIWEIDNMIDLYI
jgi:hypothetical protein